MTTTVNTDERNWAILAHVGPPVVALLSGGLLQFLVPLAVLLIKKNESAFVAHHARQALNFQLTLLVLVVFWWAIVLLSWLSLIGIPLGLFMGCIAPAFFLVWQVGWAVYAAIRANDGDLFVYPFTIPFLS